VVVGAGSAPAATRGGSGLVLVTVAGNGLKAASTLSLTLAELSRLPQTTATVTLGGAKLEERGPLLTSVIAEARLRAVTSCDDEPGRYWFELSGQGGSAVVVTSGEVASDGGNKVALLSLEQNGAALSEPRLIVTGDTTGARDIDGVTGVTVGRAAPQLRSTTSGCDPPGFRPTVTISSAPADIGAVVVNGAVPEATLRFPELEALPQVTQLDTYTGEGEQKVHREHGPTLYDVLVKADPALKSLGQTALRYYVELTSSEDGDVALVSWAEIDPAYEDKPFLLSTYEDEDLILDTDTGPRLTAPGDASGSRYVYGIQVVTVFQAP
jgi:hypothetical protein